MTTLNDLSAAAGEIKSLDESVLIHVDNKQFIDGLFQEVEGKHSKESMTSLRLLAESGSKMATGFLIVIHATVEKYKDLEKSRVCASSASDFLTHEAKLNECRICLFILGVCCQMGIRWETDEQKAARLFSESAKFDYPPGQTALGFCYERGIGVIPNKEKALMLYKLAADQEYIRYIVLY